MNGIRLFFFLLFSLLPLQVFSELVNGDFSVNDLEEMVSADYSSLNQGWRVKTFTDWSNNSGVLELGSVTGANTRVGQFFDASDLNGQNWALNFSLTLGSVSGVELWAGVDDGNNASTDIVFHLGNNNLPEPSIVTGAGWSKLLDLTNVPSGTISEEIPGDLSNYDVMVLVFRVSSGTGNPILRLDDVSIAKDYSAWGFSKELTINTSSSGANLSNSLEDFPLMVRFNATNFNFIEAKSTGADLRFTTSSGKELSHEIEYWDPSGYVGAVWVKMDNILSQNSTQKIVMYWGNQSASTVSNPSAVFDTANGFMGVWHLSEEGGTAVDNYKDATQNGHHAEGINMTSNSAVESIIGRGQTFDGVDTYINTNRRIMVANQKIFTITGWIAPEKLTDVSLYGRDNDLEFSLNTSGALAIWNTWINSPSTPYPHSVGEWHMVTISDNGTFLRMHIDGAQVYSQNKGVNYAQESTNFTIAGYTTGFPKIFLGMMDEIRISGVGRSDDWLKMSFHNQKENSNIITFGPTVTFNVPVIGYDTDNVIPANRITQIADGAGSVDIEFRVKDADDSQVKIKSLQYSTGAGLSFIGANSPAMSSGWMDVNYATGSDFSGTINKLTVKTGQLPDLAGKYVDNFYFVLVVENDQESEAVQTGVISLDNEYPSVTISNQTTPIRSPEISGTSSEPLTFVQLTINGVSHVGTITGPGTFTFPAGTIANLSNGTYSLSVTATDVWGNTANQSFTNVLTILGTAPQVTVNPIITNSSIPALSGTVGDNAIRVDVTIGAETHPAVISNGVWTVASGTFASLGEGTYNVTATAFTVDEQGVDGTSGELIIDQTPPIFTMGDVVSNLLSPGFQGSVNEPVDSVLVSLNNQWVKAELTNMVWEIPTGSFSGLTEGEHSLVLKTTDLAGNTTLDSTHTVKIDLTGPQKLSVSPFNILTSLAPSLRIEFDEPVVGTGGRLRLIKSLDSSVQLNLRINEAFGQGTNTLRFDIVDSLDEKARYHVTIANNAVLDLAGNTFVGIEDSSSWAFTTASKNATFVNRVTSPDSSGIYPIGKEISLSLIFTEPVTLTGGNLNITLETGLVDSVIVIPPFTNAQTINFSYTVSFGDYTEALDVKSLVLDSGAVIKNANDGDVILDIGVGQNLSFEKQIGLDGRPLSLDVIKPESDSKQEDALVTYNLSKNIASGFVTWKQVDPSGTISENELVKITLPFSVDMLTQGYHNNENLNAVLTSGALYNVTFNILDSAGSNVIITKTNVQIGGSVQAIRISPEVYEYQLNQSVQFKVLDKNTGEPVIGGARWSLTAGGTIDALGLFKATTIGKTSVIAQVGALVDTLAVKITSGVIPIPPGTQDVITAADNLLIQPNLPFTNTNTLQLNFTTIADSLLNSLDVAGPAIQFDNILVDSVTFFIKPDPDWLSDSSKGDFAVYQLVDSLRMMGSMKWIPSEFDGTWVSFTVQHSELGNYILAKNKSQPSIQLIQSLAANEGDSLWVSYLGTSNIINPQITLEFIEGGSDLRSTLGMYHPVDTAWSVIPGPFISPKGLIYRVKIEDGSHTVRSNFREVNVMNRTDIPAGVSLQNNIYQSFTVPLKQLDNRVETTLMDEWGEENRAVWRLYKYEKAFVELTKNHLIEPGEAYWYNMRGITPKITIEANKGESVPLITGTTKNLASGWNTFGNPYLFPITLADLQKLNGGGPLVVYAFPQEGSFTQLTQESLIEPWQGYVIWNGIEGTPILNSLKIAGYVQPTKMKKSKQADWGEQIFLGLQTADAYHGDLTIAYNTPGAKPGQDVYDLPKPTSPGSRLSLSLKVPWSEMEYLTDRRGGLGEGQGWAFSTYSSVKNEQLTLILETPQITLPTGYQAVLWHKSRGLFLEQSIPVKNPYQFIASQNGGDDFELLIGTQEYIAKRKKESQAVVKLLLLSPNAPNPFIHTTRIRYQVPALSGADQNALVQLDVYNTKGVRVKTLVNNKQPMGHYQVQWNGRDDKNQPLPAGAYFYRLKAGNELKQRKLVILK